MKEKVEKVDTNLLPMHSNWYMYSNEKELAIPQSHPRKPMFTLISKLRTQLTSSPLESPSISRMLRLHLVSEAQ